MSSQLDSHPPAIASLFFVGSVSANPGPAAWGAEAVIKINETTKTLQWSAPIGHATDNVAEYLGLISGLRRIIHHLQSESIRHSLVPLKIHSDAQHVFDQLTGRSDVTSALLSPLYIIAVNLVARFVHVQFIPCSRDQMESVDVIAKQTRQATLSSIQTAVYYPALLNLVDAWVAGSHTLASHDIGTAGSDPSCFIDADFLRSLPQGKLLLSTLQDPHPLSIILGKVNMTVLGTTTLNLGLSFSRRKSKKPDPQPQQTALVDFIVVHSLPVPVHISHRHPQIGMPDSFELGARQKLERESFPEPYSQHRYWHSDTDFIGVEYS